MATSIATRAKGRSPISGIAPPAPLENTFTARSSSWKISLGAKDVNRATLSLRILEVRILNELCTHFLEVRILQGLAVKRPWVRDADGAGKTPGSFELTFELTRHIVTSW